MTDEMKTRQAIRVRVARTGGQTSAVGAAFFGFLLGSLTAIIFRPPSDTDEGTLAAYLVGGFVGAIVSACAFMVSRRLLSERLGARALRWAAGVLGVVASFIAGAIAGLVGQTWADAFFAFVKNGNEILPGVVAAALLAMLTSLLVAILEHALTSSGIRRNEPDRPNDSSLWTAIFAGGLVGGAVGATGGALASAVTIATKASLPPGFAPFDPGLVPFAAREAVIFGGWVGSLVGVIATSAFAGCARLLRRNT